MNKKDILEAYKSIIVLPVMHQRYLKYFLNFEEPLVTLTKEIIDLIDKRVGLANYGFETSEDMEKLVGTKCFVEGYRDNIDETKLMEILNDNDEEEIDNLYIYFYDKLLPCHITDEIEEAFDDVEDYPWSVFNRVAVWLYVYVENGGDIDKLVKDVTRRFLKKRK